MRVRALAAAILVLFGALVIGLFYTQVVKNNLYWELSEKNRIRIMPLAAPRGKIYDRGGTLLVSNRLSFDVQVVFQEIKAPGKIADSLSGILGIDRESLAGRMEKAKDRPFVPVTIAEDIEKDKAVWIEEIIIDLPGIIVTTRPLRNYIKSKTFSHVTGYLGKISEAELKKYRTYGYRMQDYVGKDGVERTYNDYLKGTDGGLQVEVDSRGRELRLLAVKEPQPGRDIYLTLDAGLQDFCDSLLGAKRGVIVVMDPRTGAVLGLVSHPDYDPNVFAMPDNAREVSRFLEDSAAFPMLDRAIGGVYPLGSVFKIAIMTAALDSRKFDGKKNLSCYGTLRVGDRIFHCWNEKGHGAQNITEAVKNSCNVFFYQLGLLVGVDEISKYAFMLGLGRPTGIDLPGEASGLVPTPSWKKSRFKSAWFKGETANYAIGQGYLLVTPIQVACLVSAVANGGNLVEPFVVDRIEDVTLPHGEPKNIGLGPNAIETVKEGLRMVVNDRHGTGLYAKSSRVVISGKTGTAQNPRGVAHAWFAGFAPFEDPKLAVVVFIEHGGKGGLDPARFSKRILEQAKKMGLL